MTARRPLSALEQKVMGVLWAGQEATAADVEAGLSPRLRNATVRTLLRRLEAKGYVRHVRRGRQFVYTPTVDADGAVGLEVKRLLKRFFGGSAKRMVAGLMTDGLITPAEVRALSRRIAQRKVDD